MENANDISLVFTDVAMSGMSSDQLWRKVREQWPEVKILLTSGFSEPHVAERTTGAGAAWLKKPYTASEMTIRIRSLLDRQADRYSNEMSG